MSEPRGIILAVHPSERFIATTLQRQVKLGTQRRQRGGAAAERLCHRSRLQAPQPEADPRRGGGDGLYQIDKCLAVF